MVLITLLCVALLSLSSVATRTSNMGVSQAEARANAKLALMLAIGEVQKNAGPDMRITAPSDILDTANPPLIGVWKSWQGSDHEISGTLAGRPKKPDYDSKQNAEDQNGRFLSWLVSGTKSTTAPSDANSLVSKSPSPTSVPLVSSGSLGQDDDRQVHVEPIALSDKGKYAWWMSGENQKARIPKPYDGNTPTAAQWADQNRSHSVADPEPFNLDPVLADPSLAKKAVTRSSADFIANGAVGAITPSQSFHDLSSSSMGLLTNVATGGWRKDLSLLTEKWEEQPTSGLKFFQISPTTSLDYTRPANDSDYRPANSMLYHWSDYRTGNNREFRFERGPIASWAKIKTYATLYKDMSSTSSNAPNINHRSWVDDGFRRSSDPNVLNRGHEMFHNIRIMPQMARLQIVVSHYATTSGAEPGKYRPAVLYTPIVTIWNPYNTRLTLNGTLVINPSYTLPLALNHKLSGAGAPALADEYWSVQGQSSLTEYIDKSLSYVSKAWDMRFYIRQNPMILEPGETRIFSPAAGYLNEVKTGRDYDLFPGARTGVGLFFPLDQRLVGVGGAITPAAVSLPGSVNMGVDAKFDVPSAKSGDRQVCGSAYQWYIDSVGSGRSHSWFEIFYDRADADTLFPPKTGLASATLAQCSVTPVPFLSMMLGSRIANFRATATKGVVQADPVVDFFTSNTGPRFAEQYPGNDNLLNSPWDFSVVEHSSGGDDMLPNVDNSTNSSYIVTGVRKAEGVSLIVAAELPIRPLASLADLTHMPIRGLNPTSPFTGNVVANSDASPILPKDSIVNPANSRANSRNNEQQDDSYCANHVLFDDWFFSSIAPQPSGFGPAGGADLRQNYLDFLTGKDPLMNRAYQPIHEDQAANDTKAGEIYSNKVQPADSWKTIASRLEVEGMFNVNSTSVKAWRALLGHARNQKIPYTQRNGAIELSAETDYAFSRTSVAGDRAAGEAPEVAGEYADTTEFTGYRVFTDEMLDLLAENIVEQVRARGPFLSLSEFVNRQLSTDTNLALGGAIQTALNALTADSLNPFETIQNESVVSEAYPFTNNPGFPTGYVFPEAAVGHNTYGLPGWTRQADILRPIAPILSARDDTFTIRAYGESHSADGTVQARAWCEATVQRTKDFVDPTDEADITTVPTQQANQAYGRRFKVISFRWLDADEV